MKIQNTKQLYIDLYKKKYKDNTEFLQEIHCENHMFWGACRDFSKEILQKNESWRWLSFRVDDFALNIEQNMIEKLDKWCIKGSLSKKLNCFEITLNWLFDRHVNSLKNLFDHRYSVHLNPSYITDMESCEIIDYKDLQEEMILTDFAKLSKNKKIIILKKLWEDNLYDSDFDIFDMEDLCKKYAAPPPETFLDLSYEKNYKLEQAKNGHSQLVFVFE